LSVKKRLEGISVYVVVNGNGKISLPESRLANEIFDLFVGENDEYKHFREHIRQYNSAMSFVSFGSHITLPSGYGSY